MTEPELPEHVARNRVYWDEVNAPLYAAPGAQAWARQEITWGIFGVPEDELHALPADVAGMDVVELGCGTAYFGAWLARRGARVTGIDNSAEQLKTARRLQDEHDLHFPLIHGNAEDTGLPDASFDLAVSEYGAAIWADPYRWIPEAARHPAAGWRARLPRQRHVLGADGARDGRRRSSSRSAAARPTSGCIGSTGPTSRASSSTSGTATGSGCCERAASRWST